VDNTELSTLRYKLPAVMSHISTDLSTEKKPPDVRFLATEKWEQFDPFMRKKTSYFFSAKKNPRDMFNNM